MNTQWSTVAIIMTIMAFVGGTMALASAFINLHTTMIKADPTATTPVTKLTATLRELRLVTRLVLADWKFIVLTGLMGGLAVEYRDSQHGTPPSRTLYAILVLSHTIGFGYYRLAEQYVDRRQRAFLDGLRTVFEAPPPTC